MLFFLIVFAKLAGFAHDIYFGSKLFFRCKSLICSNLSALRKLSKNLHPYFHHFVQFRGVKNFLFYALRLKYHFATFHPTIATTNAINAQPSRIIVFSYQLSDLSTSLTTGTGYGTLSLMISRIVSL